MPDNDVAQAMETRPGAGTQRAVSATWRLAVLVVVIAGIGLVLAHSLRVYFVQSQEIAEMRAQIVAEKEKITGLEDKLARWNDPAYVRSVARQRLGWVMPGETGYRVIGADGKPLQGPAIGTNEAEEPQGPWWDRMWRSVKVADAPAPASSPAPQPSPSPSR